MEKMLAYCGLICTECPAFIATQNDDRETLATLATEWGSEEMPFTAEDVLCDGCLGTDGRLFAWCRECEIRNCAAERGVITCAHCPDYGCEILQRVFAMGELGAAIKTRLDDLHAQL